jgi:hypothetical protein
MCNLVGQYQTDNSNLLKESQIRLHLVIGTRKKTTPQKPKNYLLQRVNPKEHLFISSLYEWPQRAENGTTAYYFDWKGNYYSLTINQIASTAAIFPLTEMPTKEAASPNGL